MPGRAATACGRPDVHRSFRLNGDDQENLNYLLEVWGEDDAALTANGAVRRALKTAAALERGRRTR